MATLGVKRTSDDDICHLTVQFGQDSEHTSIASKEVVNDKYLQ